MKSRRITIKAGNEGGAAHLERYADAVQRFATDPSASNWLGLDLAMRTLQDAHNARRERERAEKREAAARNDARAGAQSRKAREEAQAAAIAEAVRRSSR